MANPQTGKKRLFVRCGLGKVSLGVCFSFMGLWGSPASHGSLPRHTDTTGVMPRVVSPDVRVVTPGVKICQLVGEYDRQLHRPTQNRTYSRYHLKSTDLGSPFRYRNRTYVLFGDTQGDVGGDRDAIAYTTDTGPGDGLSLTFIHSSNGIYKPVTIPGIEQGAYDVPMDGVEVHGQMYIYATTGHTDSVDMGSSVMARSDDSGRTFHKIYTFSKQHFINVSVVKVEASAWKLLPGGKKGKALIIFGTGTYRRSDIYLAWQPAKDIENRHAVRYFAGINKKGYPVWSAYEQAAVPLFQEPSIGELSVTYNVFIHRWILLYNCSHPRAINMRTAKYPWGPWTKQQEIFNAWKDGGFCHFIHTSWLTAHCDSVMDPGRENAGGAVYGPYQYGYFAKGDSTAPHPSTTIYFNMSTWNPYSVVLMKAKLVEDHFQADAR